jgi:flagellar biosynthesis protein FliR
MQLELSQASLVALMLASVRAAAWLMVVPPFNSRSVPGPVKGLLSVAIALPVAPGLTGQVPTGTGGDLILALVEQIVIGAALGFLTALFFAAVQAAGSLIDLFGGFTMANAYDPFAMSSNAVFARFYNVIASTLLFTTDAHVLILRGFTNSYRSLPLDGALSLSTLSRLLTGGIGEMFVAAIQIAGPLIAVLFCADVALGLLTRVAPALNVFSIAFPLKIMLTLAVAGAALALLPHAFDVLVDRAVDAVLTVLGAGR